MRPPRLSLQTHIKRVTPVQVLALERLRWRVPVPHGVLGPAGSVPQEGPSVLAQAVDEPGGQEGGELQQLVGEDEAGGVDGVETGNNRF